MLQKGCDRRQILSAQLHQNERVFRLNISMYRLDKTGFSHATRAPEKGIICCLSSGKTAGILQQSVAGAVYAHQQIQRDAIDGL